VSVRIVSADDIRASVGFEDLIEPVSRAFEESSAGLADNGLLVMFPAERPELGDVYVKTGSLRGHDVYIVKVSPWFSLNVERGQPQGGFVGVFDSHTGRTLALLNEEHYLSDIRTGAAGALAARMLAPSNVKTAAVLGAGVQAYWQPLALYRERPFTTLLIWARSLQKAEQLKARLCGELPDVDIRCSSDIERTVRSADVLHRDAGARAAGTRGVAARGRAHHRGRRRRPNQMRTRRDGASTCPSLRGCARDQRGQRRRTPSYTRWPVFHRGVVGRVRRSDLWPDCRTHIGHRHHHR
jgi:Ornithine cyclodeaminase/mu-crystallin family